MGLLSTAKKVSTGLLDEILELYETEPLTARKMAKRSGILDEIDSQIPRPKGDVSNAAALRAEANAQRVGDAGYKGQHSAPMSGDNAPLHDLSQVYPDDIYSSKGLQYYGTGNNAIDTESMDIIKSLKGKPDQTVTMYRSVPSDAGDVDINAGDWVSLSESYVKQHGESALNGDYKIISKEVPANQLFTNGDSINEFGFDPSSKGLLMDTPSRMTRAKEQGFDTDTKWYHGTSVDADPKTGLPFKEFDSSLLGSSSGAKDTRHGFYFAKNRSTADAYRPTSEVINKKKFESEYGLSIDDAQKQKSNSMDELSFWGLSDKEIQPLRSPKNVEKLPDYMKDSGWDYSATNRKLNPATYTSNRQYRPSEWISEVKEGSNFSVNLNTSNFKEVDMGGSSWDANIQDSIAKEAKLDGYEGVIFKNMQDSGWFGGSGVDDIALAFETKNIRSPDAAFDPAKISSSNLLASNPVATTGAGLMANVTGQPSNLSSYMQGNTDAYLTSAERQYLQNKQAFESNFSDDTGWDRADILPFRVNEQTGEREFATPEMIKGLLSGLYDIGQSKNTKISNPASLLELI